ncbi:hypothetical protein BC936DRAFT_140864 [Jimgerdemannia flammicorona]|uniref:BRCT domain-containing protein n=1 Tax=Jimgerdemannia flammicorona TaxID=994334 RepID=A0A433DGM7_9FUNG|nr:hypothetical protein BC936DRAFT_140864 [Jimgerdemannia flammicorona]
MPPTHHLTVNMPPAIPPPPTHHQQTGARTVSSVLFNLIFTQSGVSSQQKDTIRQKIMLHSGTFIEGEMISVEPIVRWYTVVPFKYSCESIPRPHGVLVTSFWLEKCFSDSILHSPCSQPPWRKKFLKY